MRNDQKEGLLDILLITHSDQEFFGLFGGWLHTNEKTQYVLYKIGQAFNIGWKIMALGFQMHAS